MNNLLFCTTGIGFAHAVRSLSIIRKLREDYKVTLTSYKDSYDYYQKNGVNSVQLKGFKTHGDNGINVWETIVNEKTAFFKIVGDFLKIKKLNKEQNYKAVVSDSDPIGVLAANFLQKKNIVIQNIFSSLDEVKYFPFRVKQELNYQLRVFEQVSNYLNNYVDLFIETSFEAKKDSEKNKQVSLMTDKRTEAQEYERIKEKDFICFPISGTTISSNIIKQLLSLTKKFPKETFHFLNYPTNSIKKVDNVFFYPFLNSKEIKSHIKASKAVISFAGFNTITDILFFKKPSLILPIKNHFEQTANATYLRRNKLAEVIYSREDFGNEVLEKSLQRILSNLNYYSENIKSKNFKFEGIEETVQILKQEIN